MRKVSLTSLLWCFTLFLTACGGSSSHSPLQSIKINQQLAGPSAQFTATGIHVDRSQSTPLSVAWYQWTFTSSFLGGNPLYRLSGSPFLPQCTSGIGLTIMAVTPIDPHAPSNGSIPVGVFLDFAQGKTNNEAGFLAQTTQLNCP